MMKRRTTSFHIRSSHHHKWKRRLFFAILLCLCIGSFVLLEIYRSTINLLMPFPNFFAQKPKIAFLFIARNRLPLDFVWDSFFRGDKDKSFSVFVHSRPGFLFNKATTKSLYFLNRQVNDSIQVDWGEDSMIQAERILLKSALVDPANERFIFLSDSCVPLYNFSYTYDYIMSTSTSFVDRESRHQPFPVDTSKEHNCIPDEHYVQKLLAQEGLEGEITRRSLIHTAWDLPASKDHERRGWHPVTYKFSDATPELILSIKEIDNIYYETENRREWCSNQGKPSLASSLQESLLGLQPFVCLIW